MKFSLKKYFINTRPLFSIGQKLDFHQLADYHAIYIAPRALSLWVRSQLICDVRHQSIFREPNL